MKAMILAAGYGTRLRPLTYLVPKPLFPVANKPLIGYLVENLLRAGVDEIVVNLHHLPDAIEEFLSETYDCTFHFSLEHQILGTGGAVRRMRKLLEDDDDFLLVNGDTLQFPRFDDLLSARRKDDALAALTLRHPPRGDRFTPVWLGGTRVSGFGTGAGEALMFSGDHAISRRIFDRMPDRDAFNIVDDVYRPLVDGGELAATVDDGTWFDVGTPRRYLGANAGLCGENEIDPAAQVTGVVERSAVGARSEIEGEVRDSVVWDGCRIARGVRLERCIVASGVELRGDVVLRDTVVCRDDLSIPAEDASRRENGLVFAAF